MYFYYTYTWSCILRWLEKCTSLVYYTKRELKHVNL